MRLPAYLLLLAATLLLAMPAHAQFGIKAGANIAELKGQAGQEASYKTYYHIGVFYQEHLVGPLSIQPEIQYAQAGGHLKDAFTDYDTKLHYFTLPIMLKLTAGPVFVEAGPQFGVLVDATRNGTVQLTPTTGYPSYNTGTYSATDDFKKFDFSLAAGAGLQLGNFSLGGRFVAGLNDINDAKTLTGLNDPRLQNRVVQVYAALRFGSKQ